MINNPTKKRELKIRIRMRMAQKELTGADLGRVVGVSRVMANQVIRFANRYDSARVRRAIAKVLDMPYEDAWGEPDPADVRKAS